MGIRGVFSRKSKEKTEANPYATGGQPDDSSINGNRPPSYRTYDGPPSSYASGSGGGNLSVKPSYANGTGSRITPGPSYDSGAAPSYSGNGYPSGGRYDSRPPGSSYRDASTGTAPKQDTGSSPGYKGSQPGAYPGVDDPTPYGDQGYGQYGSHDPQRQLDDEVAALKQKKKDIQSDTLKEMYKALDTGDATLASAAKTREMVQQQGEIINNTYVSLVGAKEKSAIASQQVKELKKHGGSWAWVLPSGRSKDAKLSTEAELQARMEARGAMAEQMALKNADARRRQEADAKIREAIGGPKSTRKFHDSEDEEDSDAEYKAERNAGLDRILEQTRALRMQAQGIGEDLDSQTKTIRMTAEVVSSLPFLCSSLFLSLSPSLSLLLTTR